MDDNSMHPVMSTTASKSTRKKSNINAWEEAMLLAEVKIHRVQRVSEKGNE